MCVGRMYLSEGIRFCGECMRCVGCGVCGEDVSVWKH